MNNGVFSPLSLVLEWSGVEWKGEALRRRGNGAGTGVLFLLPSLGFEGRVNRTVLFFCLCWTLNEGRVIGEGVECFCCLGWSSN